MKKGMSRPLLFASLASIAVLASPAARAQDFDVTGAGQRADDEPTRPPPPPAPRPLRFGAPGELVLSTVATGAFVSSTHFDGSDAAYFSAGVSPGFDYFFARHFSVGLDLGINYSQNKGYGADGGLVQTTQTSYSGGLRVGADFPLGERISFYPRFTFGAESLHSDRQLVSGPSISTPGALASQSQSNTGAWIAAFTPLLLHPRPHFFVGAGPRVFHGFAKTIGDAGVGGERTTIGAGLILGGSWGGEPDDAHDTRGSADAPAPDARDAPDAPVASRVSTRRFGDAGQLVLTGDLSASISSLTYRGSDAQYFSVAVAPGFDVFVANHFSIGVDLSIGYASTTGLASNGAKIDYTSTSFGIAPRVGVDVPISSSLSFYPRAAIGTGSLTQDEVSSNGAENKHTVARTWVSLYAPLLVHPEPHFFVGVGPLVVHELSATDQYGKENQRTTIGASLLLGGWL